MSTNRDEAPSDRVLDLIVPARWVSPEIRAVYLGRSDAFVQCHCEDCGDGHGTEFWAKQGVMMIIHSGIGGRAHGWYTGHLQPWLEEWGNRFAFAGEPK